MTKYLMARGQNRSQEVLLLELGGEGGLSFVREPLLKFDLSFSLIRYYSFIFGLL